MMIKIPRCLRTGVTLFFIVAAGPAQAATVLTFTDNTNPTTSYPQSSSNLSHPGGFHYSSPMTAGNEFRAIDPAGSPGALTAPGGRNQYSGGEQWVFDPNNLMSGVAGTSANTGGTSLGSAPGLGVSAAPTAGTNPSIGAADTIISPYSFLAPTTTNLAGSAYGAAQLAFDFTSQDISVLFPVLEMQWDNAWFPMGAADNDSSGQGDGVTFFGTLSNIASCGSGCTNFDFRMFAEETFDNIVNGQPGSGDLPDEDPFSAWGESGSWTFQWEVTGSGVHTVPIPGAVWLFGSGLLGLIGFARRNMLSST